MIRKSLQLSSMLLFLFLLAACQPTSTPATALPPTSTPTSAVTPTATLLPTPNPLTSTVTMWSSVSPDGQFVARGIFSIPNDGSSDGATFANVSVGKPNGAIYWTLVNEWLPVGLGDYKPQPFLWSQDSRTFYYTNVQAFDGCKALPTNGSDLWSVNIKTGEIRQELPMVASFIALSPDESRLAYVEQGSLDLVFKNLHTGAEEHRLSLDPGRDFDAGALSWSPDGTLVVLTLALNPCQNADIKKPPFTAATTVLMVNTLSYAEYRIVVNDPYRKVSSGWRSPDEVELTDPDGKTFLYDIPHDLLKPYRTPVPEGVFPLVIFYEPLVLHYDTSLWIDQTQYADPNYSGYALQSKRLRTCQIGMQGPTDLNDPTAFTSEDVTLGSIKYHVIQFKEETESGLKIAWYLVEDQSILGFSFEMGTPILVMQASPAEWAQCKVLSEDVFATLSMPAGSIIPQPTPSTSALKMESHEIAGTTALDPFHFTTTDGQVFDSRITPYDEPGFPDNSYFGDSGFCLKEEINGSPLIACQHFNQNGSRSWVSVTLDGKEVYSIPTGDAYPLNPLQGLWVYGDHWALETVHITTHTKDNVTTADLVGQVSMDGRLMNEELHYEESFGFQTLAGLPFYFFKRDGKLGYSYNGVETALDFDSIPHYGCCSASALNPIPTPHHVDFFARRGDSDYFVILGVPAQ